MSFLAFVLLSLGFLSVRFAVHPSLHCIFFRPFVTSPAQVSSFCFTLDGSLRKLNVVCALLVSYAWMVASCMVAIGLPLFCLRSYFYLHLICALLPPRTFLDEQNLYYQDSTRWSTTASAGWPASPSQTSRHHRDVISSDVKTVA